LFILLLVIAPSSQFIFFISLVICHLITHGVFQFASIISINLPFSSNFADTVILSFLNVCLNTYPLNLPFSRIGSNLSDFKVVKTSNFQSTVFLIKNKSFGFSKFNLSSFILASASTSNILILFHVLGFLLNLIHKIFSLIVFKYFASHHAFLATLSIISKNFSHSIGDKLLNHFHNFVHFVIIVAPGISQTPANTLSYHTFSIL
jgi:hypothetical protein